MENPYEERQSLLLERIIRNVSLLNEALKEVSTSVTQINQHNQAITIAGEMWEGYRRNAAFNLQNIDGLADQHASPDTRSDETQHAA
ncbi:uncharacterized protein PFL1_03657 [Pseudozyma flocculosa PF-1]|uniref:DASH complex subunit DAD4 n=2 Tax=Pseudozyma flocculosa TaxID=84751 RepID=A0A5C3F4C5_9BASI|nr:uncharacterized protein PFL1_03657 [Pseudozyma flocculosa PF-1]EPQ28854.1 hypothetical protein PFL1_03657 [Pseudozyma flocculosa PF-1]SPO39354.1 related to DAD4 - outer kinetochore protein (part of Dam1 complex) [Pseudozyma flocculosa]